jgi:hypothetical protein
LLEKIQLQLDELHPGQLHVINTARRFNTLKCGRRWGKTKLSEELLLCPDYPDNGALNGFPVAYFAPTYKMLMDVWRAMTNIVYDITESKSETEKRIELFGGGVIDFWSLEDPNSIRGRKYKRVVMDEVEVARNLKEGWQNVIRPTLTDLKGDAWFLSTPKFGSTYFKQLAKIDNPEWMNWSFTTYDNPFMDRKEIDSARDQLDEATFRCEFLAEDVTLAVNKFIYNFDPKKHIQKGLQSIPHLPIILSFDFNTEPITCLVGQHDGLEKVLILDEYRLMNSDIEELCLRVLSDYGNRMLLVTGDASGQNRTALKRDLNYYKIIKQVLRLGMGQFKLPAANPPIKNTRVLCNSLLGRHTYYLFSDRVPYLVMDIQECEVDEHGQIDKGKDKHQSHLLDCWRYFNWTFLRNFLDLKIYDEKPDIFSRGNT